jgi:hypothetical protein
MDVKTQQDGFDPFGRRRAALKRSIGWSVTAGAISDESVSGSRGRRAIG